jgi:ATP-binding cassette, subfamily B, bacterial PglK
MTRILGKLLALTEPAVRRRLAVLAVLFMVTTAFDSVSIVLVFSLFNIIVAPETLNEVGWLRAAREHLAFLDLRSFLIVICVGLFLLFLGKGALQLLANAIRLRVEWLVRAGVGARLLDRYLSSPYRFHLRRSVNELVRNVHGCAGQISTCVLNVTDLMSDGLILVGLGAVLVVLQPIPSVIAFGVLALLGTAYLTVGKRYFRSWGESSNAANELMYRAVLEPLAGIKQIKALGVERFFVDAYLTQANRYGAVNLRNAFALQSLKPALEIVLMAGLLAPVTILLVEGAQLNRIVPVLIMFAAAFYRMLPSVIRWASALQNLRFSQPSIEIVHGDLATSDPAEARTTQAAPAAPRRLQREIRLDKVGFRYEGADAVSVMGIDLVIRRGQSVGLVGPSGAGKTTLADLILGLLEPTEGTILIDGVPMPPGIGPQPSLSGYVPQDSFLVNDTACQNVAPGSAAGDIDRRRVERAIDAASLGPLFKSRPDGIDTIVGDRGVRLSGGQRQRLAIARALYHDPDVLVLDEATSSLDSVTEAEVADAIQVLRGRKTLIVIAHRLSTVRNCDVLFYLEDGRLIDSGRFDELVARNAGFRLMAEVTHGAGDAPARQQAAPAAPAVALHGASERP